MNEEVKKKIASAIESAIAYIEPHEQYDNDEDGEVLTTDQLKEALAALKAL